MTDRAPSSTPAHSADDIDVLADLHPAEFIESTSWEDSVDGVFAWVPYVALTGSALLAQLGDLSSRDRAWRLGLCAVAAVWTWLTFTRMGPPHSQAQPLLRTYMAGFVILAATMMLTTPVFVIYAITGFFHATLLRPWWLAFVGLGATSMIVYSTIWRM